MPELPEVHTVVSDLNNHVVGYKIAKAIANDRYSIHPDRQTLVSSINGTTIIGVERVAKNILVKLDNGNYIHFHLAMTGRILLREDTKAKDAWTHFAMKLVKDSSELVLKFTDMRMFGKLGLLSTEERKTIENKYGPDLLESTIYSADFLKLLKSKNTNIKNVLLDQKIVSGLGNIYATDALYMAGVNPNTKTKDLTLEQADKLLTAAKEILNEGIAHRGSTLPDRMYVDILGKPGSHQNYFRIYMKEKCPRCGTPTNVEKIAGRGTYYCPSCQI